ncbi:WYL domain-containing protein [Yokenella regensburgei]|uniref:helix-turn-helix transcriptional regulator n=1 Tax=Yokenella regensburgei TaxID=158877 RepID=UPI003F161932
MNKRSENSEKLARRLAETLVVLQQNDSVTRTHLAERFSVSDRTVFRDLSRFEGVIEHIGGERYRLRDEYRQRLQAGILQTVIDLTGGAGHFSMPDARVMRSLASHQNSYFVKTLNAEHAAGEAINRYFTLLQSAVDSHRCCTFNYKGKPRQAHPYQLRNIKNIWYLAAIEDNQLKAFRLSLIEFLTVTREVFTPDPAVLKTIQDEEEAWFSLEKFEVTLTVAAAAAEYFLRRDLLPHQQILRREADGSLLLSTRVADDRQILSVIRYWLPHLKIQTPASLTEKLKGELRQALEALSCEGQGMTHVE